VTLGRLILTPFSIVQAEKYRKQIFDEIFSVYISFSYLLCFALSCAWHVRPVAHNMQEVLLILAS
jgi:hypothetical protein